MIARHAGPEAMARSNSVPTRGPIVTCWLVLILSAIAGIIVAAIWGPFMGLPKVPVDGSLLMASGIRLAVISPFALFLLVPARRILVIEEPRLWRVTRIAAIFLSAYVLWVAFLLFALSQATDL